MQLAHKQPIGGRPYPVELKAKCSSRVTSSFCCAVLTIIITVCTSATANALSPSLWEVARDIDVISFAFDLSDPTDPALLEGTQSSGIYRFSLTAEQRERIVGTEGIDSKRGLSRLPNGQIVALSCSGEIRVIDPNASVDQRVTTVTVVDGLSNEANAIRNRKKSIRTFTDLAGNSKGDVFVLEQTVNLGYATKPVPGDFIQSAVFKLVKRGEQWVLVLVAGYSPSRYCSALKCDGLAASFGSLGALAVTAEGGFFVGENIHDAADFTRVLEGRSTPDGYVVESRDDMTFKGFTAAVTHHPAFSSVGQLGSPRIIGLVKQELTSWDLDLCRQASSSAGVTVGIRQPSPFIAMLGSERGREPASVLIGKGTATLSFAGDGEDSTKYSLSDYDVKIAASPDGGLFLHARYGYNENGRVFYLNPSHLQPEADQIEELRKALGKLEPLSYSVDHSISTICSRLQSVRNDPRVPSSRQNKNTAEWWAAFRAKLAQRVFARLVAKKVESFESSQQRLSDNIISLRQFLGQQSPRAAM